MDEASKQKFDKFLKQAIKELRETPSGILAEVNNDGFQPSDQTVYETFYNHHTAKWSIWAKDDVKLSADLKFHQIFVPTIYSNSHSYIVQSLIEHNFPVLFVGKTGTGKTCIIKKFLLNDAGDKFVPTITALSANISCRMVQDVIESRLEKQKRRKGVYGPIIGKKNIIFIDDLNMPNKEKYGAQPPIEIIRQWFS